MEKTKECDEYSHRTCKESFQCPSCDIELKPGEVKRHCELEVKCLMESQNSSVKNISVINGENNLARSCPWSVFQKVQKNRQSRSEIKSRKRSLIDVKCPTCSTLITRDINGHMDACSKSSNGRIDAINDDNTYRNAEIFEEYEWAGQKRIRVSSLLQGGYASIGIGTNKNNKENEEDEDLNVDEDDTKVYGPTQYNETHVISPDYIKNEHTKECCINDYLRQLITDSFESENYLTSQEKETNSTTEDKDIDNFDQQKTEYLEKLNPKSALQIINSLKYKLRQWEVHTQNKFKCLICLDEYHNPAISVSCWHVHCEECWLRSLGARKLCPQCNLITSPSDLRRIYM